MEKNATYIMFESAMVRAERTNRRLWILAIILIFALVATNAFWVYREMQYEPFETSIEAQQDGSDTNIIGGGDIDYGSKGKN